MLHLLPTLAAAFAMMTLCWAASLGLRDVSIVDILWAPAFAALGWLCAALGPAITPRGWMVLGLITLWGLRLGGHIFLRWRRLGHEDYRYAAIRTRRGPRFAWTSLFWIFWLQALLLWVISLPLQAAIGDALPLGAIDAAGGALALAGLVLEAVADAQLTRFRARADSRGRVLDTGLWAWSRHPNYFGDFAFWWSIWLIAVSGGAPLWTVLGPVAMSALLLHYSGAGLMEDTIAERRPAYRDYIRRTSLFFPWPPRRRVASRSN
jgi:steroid 5-alpha reductase family enzyme